MWCFVPISQLSDVRCKHHFRYLNSRVLLQGSVVNNGRTRNIKAAIMKSYVGQAEIAEVWKTSWKVLKSREKKLKTTLSCSVTKSCYVHSSRYVTTGHNKYSHFFIFPLIIILILVIFWRSQYMRLDFFGTQIHVCSTAYPGKPAIRCWLR